jgi:hypothetical protein
MVLSPEKVRNGIDDHVIALPSTSSLATTRPKSAHKKRPFRWAYGDRRRKTQTRESPLSGRPL